MSAPLPGPVIPIPKPSAVSLPLRAHDLSARSFQQLHNPQTRRLPGPHSLQLPSPLLQEFGNGTLEPRQYDTDNAKSSVITYEICSLLPPSFRCCGNNSEEGIAVSGLQANPIRDRHSQSHMTTPIGCGFLRSTKLPSSVRRGV